MSRIIFMWKFIPQLKINFKMAYNLCMDIILFHFVHYKESKGEVMNIFSR